MKKLKIFLSFLIIFCTVFACLPVTAEAAFPADLETTSEGIILINLDTNTTVYEKNADMRLAPASITKVILARMFIDEVGVDQLDTLKIKVPAYCIDALYGTNSSLGGLQRNETVTAYQLLCFLLIPSGNDAAMVIADYLGLGDIDTCVDAMNAQAEALGCTNTHFSNPHGLYEPDHYASARDIAVITQWALENDIFTEISKKTSYVVPANETVSYNRTLNTTNLMKLAYSSYYYRYVQGVKTGSTTDGGYCLVSTAYNAKLDYRYLCVTLDAPYYDADGKAAKNGAMIDTKTVYEWAFANLEMKQLIQSTDAYTSIKVERSWFNDSLLVYPAENVSLVVPKEVTADGVILVPDEDFPQKLTAPIEKGTVIGRAKILYADMELGQVDLVAGENISESFLLHMADLLGGMFNSSLFKVILIILLILLIAYICLTVWYNKKMKRRKKRSIRRKF